jgi:hypothetical protein
MPKNEEEDPMPVFDPMTAGIKQSTKYESHRLFESYNFSSINYPN